MAFDRKYKDKMMSRPPPGYWMTQDVKATPPKTADVESALSGIIDNLSLPVNRNKTKAFIYAGVPITTLVESISLTGYAENAFNPDVAELIKPALSVYLTDIAVEDDFKGSFNLSGQPETQSDVEEIELEDTLMRLMEEKNPHLAKAMYTEMDEAAKVQAQIKKQKIKARQDKMEQKTTPKSSPTGGFITRDKESI